MPLKTVHVDDKLREKPEYIDDVMPIVCFKSSLDDYQGGEIPVHWHTEFLFVMLLEGDLEYNLFQFTNSPVCYYMHAGDAIFINSKVLHGCRSLCSGTKLFTFGIPPGYFCSPIFGHLYLNSVLPLIQSGILGLFLPSNCSENAALLDALRNFASLPDNSPNIELRITESVCRIWVALFDKLGLSQGSLLHHSVDMSQMDRIQSMLSFIREHYREHITVDQIAKSGQVSRRECFRQFRTVLNLTPIEFLTQFRLQKATQLLTTTRLSISEICDSCGFDNVSYFTKQFKKHYNLTPKQLRT